VFELSAGSGREAPVVMYTYSADEGLPTVWIFTILAGRDADDVLAIANEVSSWPGPAITDLSCHDRLEHTGHEVCSIEEDRTRRAGIAPGP